MSGDKASNQRGVQASKKGREIRRARLNKRLAAYSAMAAGVVAGAGESADGTLVVHDIGVNVPFDGATLIDIDGGIAAVFASPGTFMPLPGGGSDFVMFNSNSVPSSRSAFASGYNGIAVTTGSTNNGYSFPAAVRFTASQRVGTGAQSFYYYGYVNYSYAGTGGPTYPGGAYANWAPGVRGAIGVAFDIAGNNHFGWVDLTFELDGSYTIHRVGYQDIAGASAHVTPGVPEPATFGLGLLSLGAVGVSALKRRREAEAAA